MGEAHAVIAHGLSRSTRGIDIWLEPFSQPRDWSNLLQEIIASFPGASPWDLRSRSIADPGQVTDIVTRDGVIRIHVSQQSCKAVRSTGHKRYSTGTRITRSAGQHSPTPTKPSADLRRKRSGILPMRVTPSRFRFWRNPMLTPLLKTDPPCSQQLTPAPAPKWQAAP